MQKAPAILVRWVPFVAVASANCINISTVRQRELIEGVVVSDENGNPLGRSKVPCPFNYVIIFLLSCDRTSCDHVLVLLSNLKLDLQYLHLRHYIDAGIAIQLICKV